MIKPLNSSLVDVRQIWREKCWIQGIGEGGKIVGYGKVIGGSAPNIRACSDLMNL